MPCELLLAVACMAALILCAALGWREIHWRGEMRSRDGEIKTTIESLLRARADLAKWSEVCAEITERWQSCADREKSLRRQVASLRGVITRMKRGAS